jgi:signal transduction histidine kinase
MGIFPAFQSLRDQFALSLALEIEFDEKVVKEEHADRNWMPEQVRLAAYRIAEEALINAVKHAKAGKVTVRLDSFQEGWLRLTVRDNGQGFCTDSNTDGIGMVIMQDYAHAVDGECSANSDPAGSEIVATLPLARSTTAHLGSSEKGDK